MMKQRLIFTNISTLSPTLSATAQVVRIIYFCSLNNELNEPGKN